MSSNVNATQTLHQLVVFKIAIHAVGKSCHRGQEFTLQVVKRYTRNGSVIVFHDSLKSERNMRVAMPQAVEWLLAQGYTFKVF